MAIFRKIFVNILFTTVIIAYYFSIECNGSHLSEPYKPITRLRRHSNCGHSTFQCNNGQCESSKELCKDYIAWVTIARNTSRVRQACGAHMQLKSCGKINPTVRPVRDTAQRENYPWHVIIYRQKKTESNYNTIISSGSIISTNVILTSATSFTSHELGILNDINQYYIAAGKHYSAYADPRDIFAQKTKVKNIIIPADYRGAATNYKSNIAIVVLETPFEISSAVQPVCVDWQNEFEDTQLKSPNNGIVTGWRKLTGDRNNLKLRQLEVPYISRVDCYSVMPNSFHSSITQNTFCAGFSNDISVCGGAAGVGLAFHKSDSDQYYIRGVGSLVPFIGETCDTKPLLYTQVSGFLDIISKTVLDNIN